ncbi:anti-lipopolysaccharide factor-like [Penaeus chinensis]|uniref:anti-lipopolysaccharide factor-like n=1 Tax=Penaeus chinensis TaxID=139456 RepID=UPI001FB744B1|nr:anti-lipopolysaccharide factor-like [Penaeus chinensis]
MGVCVLTMALTVALAVALPSQCSAADWGAFMPSIATRLTGLWETGELELLGHYCVYSVKPTFQRWQLYFIGSMWCPGWTPIRGVAETRSRSGVVGKMTQDFVGKALKADLLSDEEAEAWLSP